MTTDNKTVYPLADLAEICSDLRHDAELCNEAGNAVEADICADYARHLESILATLRAAWEARTPTPHAYEQACKALEKHRQRANRAEAVVEAARRFMTQAADRNGQCSGDAFTALGAALAAYDRAPAVPNMERPDHG